MNIIGMYDGGGGSLFDSRVVDIVFQLDKIICDNQFNGVVIVFRDFVQFVYFVEMDDDEVQLIRSKLYVLLLVIIDYLENKLMICVFDC